MLLSFEDRPSRDGGKEGKPSEQTAEEQRKSSDLQRIDDELHQLDQRLDELDLSLDGFWAEIMAVCDLRDELMRTGNASAAMDAPICHEAPSMTADRLKGIFRVFIWNFGYPMQLLRGSPLQMGADFMLDVLRGLSIEDSRELLVISVIGAQSSAKSTLLNYLFGCDFATRAGRCTQGLYASLMQARGGRLCLLLDSEGLMSIEASRDHVFDAQLALMAMACSHVVLINHKGEMSRQLQELLEVCLFAMQHLHVCKMQPKLCFVLRDQHDRSRGVHEDALRLMRRHLVDASRHLGISLDRWLNVDSDAMYLLPSAFASDLVGSREVKWATELFASETFGLRKSLFEWAEADRVEKESGDSQTTEFRTLHSWYMHASSVWRVLDRYGTNLFNYKTMAEIELRKELAELVKFISRVWIDGAGVDGAQAPGGGLNAQGKALLDDFTDRLRQAEGDQMEQIDREFKANLQSIRETFLELLVGDFDQKTSASKQFTEALRQEFKKRLHAPITYACELLSYTWQLQLASVQNQDQLKQLKVFFKHKIEEILEHQRGGSGGMSETAAAQLFEEDWVQYDKSFKVRLGKTQKDARQIAEEVNLVFNHGIRSRRTTRHFQVLEQVNAAKLLATASDVRLSQLPIDRLASEYLSAREASLSRSMVEAAAAEIKELVTVVMSRWRDIVSASGMQFISQQDAVDIMMEMNLTLEECEEVLKERGIAFSSSPVPFLNAAHLELRWIAFDHFVNREQRRVQDQLASLHKFKSSMRDEFMSILQRQKGDVDRASIVGGRYEESIEEWLDNLLVGFAADVRGQVLKDMPDASSAAERAYQHAFVERQWLEVLEYCYDVNAYVRKIFHNLFSQRKATVVREKKPKLVEQVAGIFDALLNMALQWGRQAAKSPQRQIRVSHLQQFVAREAAQKVAEVEAAKIQASHNPRRREPGEESPVEKAEAMALCFRVVSDRFPITADFIVDDAAKFAEAFTRRVASIRSERSVEERVGAMVERAMMDQEAEVWNLIKGCQSSCPCCGSKCDVLGDHSTHSCTHHLFPAFNGWRNAQTKEATLDACKSKQNRSAAKRSDCGRKLYRNLDDYLIAEHPDWLPFPLEDMELVADSILKAAWVNCRVPLLKRYKMVDSTPRQWVQAYQEPNRALDEASLKVVEERLAPFREKKTRDNPVIR